jgi:hypothetical protein
MQAVKLGKVTTIEELLERAGARGCRLTRRTATSWVSAGILPPLCSRGMGRRRGKRYWWKERDVVDRAVAGWRLLSMRGRIVFALAGLWYAGFRLDPEKALGALLSEAERARTSIPKGARRFHGLEPADRLGTMAGWMARRLSAEQRWDRESKNAASDLIAQTMEAFAGLERLDVNDVAGLIKVVFARSWGNQVSEEADAVSAFMAKLLVAISPPNRIRIVRSASPRDLQRAHR